MPYCSNCGAWVDDGVNYCSNCGTAVSRVSTASGTTASAASGATSDYSLILVGTGSCPVSQADDILHDLLGYTTAQATQILSVLPAQIAQGLTETQALYLAQALSEYGMQVATYHDGTFVNLGSQAKRSVFASDGSLLKVVLAALAGLTIANQVGRFMRWAGPSPDPYRFVPPYDYRPPIHMRRSVWDWDLFRRSRPPMPAPAPPMHSPHPIGGGMGRPGGPGGPGGEGMGAGMRGIGGPGRSGGAAGPGNRGVGGPGGRGTAGPGHSGGRVGGPGGNRGPR